MWEEKTGLKPSTQSERDCFGKRKRRRRRKRGREDTRQVLGGSFGGYLEYLEPVEYLKRAFSPPEPPSDEIM